MVAWAELIETGDLISWGSWNLLAREGSSPRKNARNVHGVPSCLWLNTELHMQTVRLPEAIKTTGKGRQLERYVCTEQFQGFLRAPRHEQQPAPVQTSWTLGSTCCGAQRGQNWGAGLNSPDNKDYSGASLTKLKNKLRSSWSANISHTRSFQSLTQSSERWDNN